MHSQGLNSAASSGDWRIPLPWESVGAEVRWTVVILTWGTGTDATIDCVLTTLTIGARMSAGLGTGSGVTPHGVGQLTDWVQNWNNKRLRKGRLRSWNKSSLGKWLIKIISLWAVYSLWMNLMFVCHKSVGGNSEKDTESLAQENKTLTMSLIRTIKPACWQTYRLSNSWFVFCFFVLSTQVRHGKYSLQRTWFKVKGKDVDQATRRSGVPQNHMSTVEEWLVFWPKPPLLLQMSFIMESATLCYI